MSRETIARFKFSHLHKGIILMLLCAIYFYPLAVLAEKTKVVVIYPKLREPFNQVYLSLYEGVTLNKKFKVLAYELEKTENPDDFLAWIQEKKPKGIIALGNRSIDLLEMLGKKQSLPLVLGGTVINKTKQPQLRGISLAPAPKHLFITLKQLRPAVTTVNVIYEPDNYQWLIDEAKNAALATGLQLNTIPVSNIRELALAYRDAIKSQKSETEALWLPYTGYSLDKAILNQILESAWKQDLTIFSSKLADVSRGALFSLYPEHQQMGLRLSEMLLEELSGETNNGGIILSEDLLAAINTRTAEHLGISVDKQLKKQFQLLFPISR